MRRTLPLVVAAALWAAPAANVAAQLRDTCPESERVGSLGITGIRCERCSFYTNGDSHRAVFFTEPMIESLNARLPASDVLEVGDVLVAIDGELITTAAGSARFSSLPPTGTVTADVRRNGRLLRLEVPVGPTCPVTPPEAPGVVVRGRPAPVTAPDTVRAAARPAPLRELVPGAALGFGLLCELCFYDDVDDLWTFDEAPQIDRVRPGTVAWEWGVPWGGRVIAVDGLPITAEAGGRHFSRIEPGDSIRWTVSRYGREWEVVTVALDRSDAVTARTVALTGDPVSDSMRLVMSSRAGPLDVEIRRRVDGERRGGVIVTPGRDDGEVVIRIDGSEIRVRIAADSTGR